MDKDESYMPVPGYVTVRKENGMKKNVVRNDGDRYFGAWENPGKILLPYRGVEKEIAVGETSMVISYDHRVDIGRNDPSDPIAPELLRQRLAAIGVDFKEFIAPENAMSRKELRGMFQFESLLEALGAVEKPEYGYWVRQGDFVIWTTAIGKPYELLRISDVEKELARRVGEARRWINQTFPGFLRRLKLTDVQVVELFNQGSHASIIRYNVGEDANVSWQGHSYFGSGGASGTWKIWGAVSEVQETGSHDNGFVKSGSTKIHFDGPAALYTYAGDSINGGRTFWRELHIADGNTITREPG